MGTHRWLYAWGLGAVAVGAASLLVPLYVVSLGGTPLDLGLLGAVAALVGAPGALVWGRLADRTRSPRRVLVGSLLAVAALLAAMPFLSSIPLVIILNALLWLAFAAAGPVLTLLVVADVPETAWAREIALLNTYQGYGWAVGLCLGIAWSATVGALVSPRLTQQTLFGVNALAAAVAAVLIARWMPSPSARRLEWVDPARVARLIDSGRRGVRGATFLFTPNRLYWQSRAIHPRRLASRFSPTLAAYFLATLLCFTGFAAFFAPLPLFLRDTGFSGEQVYALYLASSLASAVAYTGAGDLSSRYDLRRLQAGSLGARAVIMPLVAVVGGVVSTGLFGSLLVGALFATIGVTWAIIAVTSGAIVTRIAPQAVRGEALGLHAALVALAGGIGSIAGGALAQSLGFTVAFGVAGVGILTGAVLVVTLEGISAATTRSAQSA